MFDGYRCRMKVTKVAMMATVNVIKLLFILNSCSLIGQGHVTCEPVNVDIVLEQLIWYSNS